MHNNIVTCRRVRTSLTRAHVRRDPQMDVYLEQENFIEVARLSFIHLDWHLVMTLMERWWSETHIFHMRYVKMTITLEDVGVQLELPVEGDAVIGNSSFSWKDLCKRCWMLDRLQVHLAINNWSYSCLQSLLIGFLAM